jgi:hypothetical protein
LVARALRERWQRKKKEKRREKVVNDTFKSLFHITFGCALVFFASALMKLR